MGYIYGCYNKEFDKIGQLYDYNINLPHTVVIGD